MNGLQFDSTGTKVEGYTGTDKSVVLPEGIVEIADGAFRYNDSIEEVSLPRTLKKIGIGAFMFCNALKAISIPESVEQIGGNAFSYTAIKKADINWLKAIPENLFEGCESLESVDISSARSIEQMAFSACKALKNVNFGAVEIIGESAFAGCESLTLTGLPDSLKSIGSVAFSNSIEDIVVPRNVESIGKRCFGECYGYGGESKQITIYKSLLYEFRKYLGIKTDRYGGEYRTEKTPIFMEITVLDNLDDSVTDFIPICCDDNLDTSEAIIRAFQPDNTFNYSKLDSDIWNNRLKDKNHKLIVAIRRLKYPFDLDEKNREIYAKYVSRYLKEVARKAIRDRDIEMLKTIFENKIFNNKTIKEALDYSVSVDATECTEYLLNCQSNMKNK